MLNPTVKALEDSLAELEQGHKALACSSGMAAIHTAISALVKSGDHVICSKAVYGPTATLFATVFSKFNVSVSFVNTSNIKKVEEAIKPETKVVYLESPGNPTLDISDIEEISKIAHKNNAKVIVDNTFMSPALQQPLLLGADVVVHSMTKFLNGHADVVGGCIIVKDEEEYKNFRKILNQLGGVLEPFNAFLVHRGLKTLSLRMERHSSNALAVAQFLEKHPLVEWVKFPGLKSHPQYEIGRKQHKDFSGMIAFELKGGIKAGEILMNSAKLCQLAVSLGGVETLIQHPASMTHLTMGKEARESAGITDGLVRISVGIENVNDLINDLEQALKSVEEMMMQEV
jgi:methionine-gamma-lyase